MKKINCMIFALQQKMTFCYILVIFLLLTQCFMPLIAYGALPTEQVDLFKLNILDYNWDKCSSQLRNSPKPTEEPAGGPVYILGDSITSGAKTALETALGETGLGISKINSEVSRSLTSPGEGTDSGLQAIETDSRDLSNGTNYIKNAKSIIIALGTNQETSPTAFKNKAKELINKIRSKNSDAKIFWVNLFSTVAHKPQYNRVLEELSTSSGFLVINTTGAGIELEPDDIHPTANGSKTLARVIMNSLKGGSTGNTDTTEDAEEISPATNGVTFTTGMTVNTDGVGPSHGNPHHQSQTSYANGRLNADKTNYLALAQGYARNNNLTLGDLAMVEYKGKTAYAIYGDNWQNVDSIHGEGSYRLVKELGMDFTGTSGGAESGVKYTIYPDSGHLLNGSIDQEDINRIGQQVSGGPSIGESAGDSVDPDCACQDPTVDTGATNVSLSVTSVVENLDKFSPDPDAEKVFNEQGVPQIKKFLPLYKQAAEAEGLGQNWEILAGLHWTETNFGRTWIGNGVQTVTGPFQEQTSELAQHLSDPKYADLETLVAPGGGLIGAGKEVNDKEFVVLARLAFARWIHQALGDDGYNKLKTAPVPFSETVDSNNVFWKIMGRWNNGAEGYQGFTGYNNTNYGMPQPITGYGAGGMWNKPGVATTYYLLKKNGIDGVSAGGGGCTKVAGSGGAFAEISGDRAALVNRVLSNSRLKLGNYGPAITQTSDIQNVITLDTLKMMVAIVEQSGVDIPVNAIKSDHDPGTAHEAGRAVDIGYYGNGTIQHKPEGDRLYKFIYDNHKALKISQLIWQNPPVGYKCIYGGKPADCLASYGSLTMGQHYHHIHVGL